MHHSDSSPSTRERLAVVYRPTTSLRAYAGNARTHDADQIDQIRASIREFGFTNPILLRDDEQTIGAGHGRHEAATLEGLAEVPTITLTGLTEAQWRAYVIADNAIALNAGWDEALLRAELREISAEGLDLALLGFDALELARLTGDEPVRTGKIADDEVPAVRGPTTSRLGDLWILGNHRLLVGDATDRAQAERLLAGQAADLIWTDPPYNVAVEGKAGGILNDDMAAAEFESFLAGAFSTMAGSLRAGGVIYVAHSESERAAFTRTFVAAGFKLAQVRIWVKQSATLSRQDFNWQHEPILYGWKLGAGHYFAGDFTLTTVIDDDVDLAKLRKDELLEMLRAIRAATPSTVIRQDRPTRSDLHPTMKPVALVEEMIEASSREGQIVFDPFGGAGSTLIASEKTGRRARLLELDPHFADVIARRWEAFTGRAAVLEATGQTLQEVHDERRQRGGDAGD